MSHGFKGNMRAIVRQLDALRSDPAMSQDITLRAFLADARLNGRGSSLTPNHLFAEFGIDPRVATVKSMMDDDDLKWLVYEFARSGVRRGMGVDAREQLSAARRAIVSNAITGEQGGGARWVSPEVILDPVSRGAIQAAFYNELIIREINVGNTKVTMPRIELSDAGLEDTEEAATIEEGTVVYGDKDVKITKLGKGIKITDESIMFNNVDFLSLFFEQVGRKFAAKLNGKAVTVLTNGEQADLSENAAVIGVEDTTEGQTYRDITYAWVRLGLIGRLGNTLVAGVNKSVDYLNLPEVKNLQLGSPLMRVNVRVPIPSNTDLFPASQAAPNQTIIVDPTVCMVQLTAQALKGESERFASKGLSGTYFTVYTGFAIVQRDGRVIIDETLEVASHDFPSWFDADEGD